MSRIKSHLARFHPRATWTQAMMMAAIDAHEAELARLRAMQPDLHGEPVQVEIPEFLQSVPDGLTDFVRENEPYGETKARLWKIYVDLQSRIADNGKSMELPTAEQYALHSRLSRHLDWIRGTGAVDVI